MLDEDAEKWQGWKSTSLRGYVTAFSDGRVVSQNPRAYFHSYYSEFTIAGQFNWQFLEIVRKMIDIFFNLKQILGPSFNQF